ncbi:hypothetical protein GWK47_046803 [Chionoecetes opilio]|uniref:Uncharacterized protein n=1 Tax=Chionoecetes opilio TaxID=41210 RepID=A0A8J5CTG5_CHIOP|nr:hypothetical protein GWK47_046803 [Chionoecetes opilio]
MSPSIHSTRGTAGRKRSHRRQGRARSRVVAGGLKDTSSPGPHNDPLEKKGKKVRGKGGRRNTKKPPKTPTASHTHCPDPPGNGWSGRGGGATWQPGMLNSPTRPGGGAGEGGGGGWAPPKATEPSAPLKGPWQAGAGDQGPQTPP